MEENKGFKNRVEAFLAGKGFYIVLFVCLAVIGVSAWALLFSGTVPGVGEEPGEDYVSVMAGDETPAVSDVPDVYQAAEKPAVKREEPAQTKPAPAETAPAETEKEKKAAQEEDAEEAGDKTVDAKELTFIWPISGTVAVAYSPDALLYSKTMADWRVHDGVDIAAQIGAKVLAVAEGKVEKIYDDDLLGTTVIISHGGDVKSVYSNLAAVPTVKEGEAVTMGSVIGAVGDTALGETGEVAHLHFAMEAGGVTADPADYLPKR